MVRGRGPKREELEEPPGRHQLEEHKAAIDSLFIWWGRFPVIREGNDILENFPEYKHREAKDAIYNGDMLWRCIFTEAFEEAERAWAAEKALEREREDNEAVEEGPLSLSAPSSTEVE